MVNDGKFRKDLFFRLNVVPIKIPALRERVEEIPAFIHFYLEHFNRKYSKNKAILHRAIDCLRQYPFPGNIRELRNAIQYAFVLCPGGGIGVEHLPPKILTENKILSRKGAMNPSSVSEREKLVQILNETGGNQSEAAKVLGVSRVTIWKRIKKYGINLVTDIHSKSDTI